MPVHVPGMSVHVPGMTVQVPGMSVHVPGMPVHVPGMTVQVPGMPVHVHCSVQVPIPMSIDYSGGVCSSYKNDSEEKHSRLTIVDVVTRYVRLAITFSKHARNHPIIN